MDYRKSGEILSAPKPCVYKMGTMNDTGTLSGVARLFYGDASKWRVSGTGGAVYARRWRLVDSGDATSSSRQFPC